MTNESHILQSVVIPYFNFAVFLGVLIYFFRKPLTIMAQTRRDKFLASTKESSEALEKANAEFKQIKERFEALNAELSTFKTESENQARAEAAKIVSEGDRLAAQILSETKKVAEEEIARARRELRDEIVSAAKDKASKQLASSLSDAEKSKILSTRISDLKTYRV
jgi:F-type H+-transporting ATPase subunit b